MDANRVLDELREVQFQIDSYNDAGEPRFMGEWRRMAEGMAELFAKLDGYLQSGGTPPEVWREGPDAPELGTLTCLVHGVVPEQDGGGCRLCDEGEVPDNG